MRAAGTGVLAAVALAVSPAASGGEPQACTEIGCVNGITLLVAKAPAGTKRLVMCVDDRCRRKPLQKVVRMGCDEAESVRLAVVAKDGRNRRIGRYEATVPLTASQPNGPNCPPTCFFGTARLNGERLTASPSGRGP